MNGDNVRYKIVQASGSQTYPFEVVERVVERMIGQGWVPLGGVAISMYSGGCVVAQAMMIIEPQGDAA